MRRRILFLVLSLAVLVWSGSLPFVAESDSESYLQVIDAQPSPLGPLALDETITFTFNRRVDCAAAEAALSWAPAISGRLSCDEYSISFAPAGRFQRATDYTFTLAPPLAAKDGAIMSDAYRANYSTAGFLEVAEVFPQPDSASVAVDSAITVVFDRPVAPLATSLDADELPHPLVLSPAIEGTGEWVNTAIYVLTPSEPLHSLTEYKVDIADDLEAVDGAAMAGAFNWSFKTEAPSIVSIHPRPTSHYSWRRWDNMTLKPKIQVRFNHVMDRSAVESAFFFRAGLESDSVELAGTFDWAEDGKGFAFTPDARLWYDTEYKVGFPPGLPFSRGRYFWSYRTAPRPAIKRASPADGSLGVSGGGFSLHFASRMNIDTLPEHIHIEPKPEALTREYYSTFNDRFDVHFKAQPSTEYTIRIEPGMEDIYGNAIAEPLTFSFTTDKLPPMLRLRVPGPVGFYNAYRGPTQLYLTHRGLDKINLELYRVPTDEFVKQLIAAEFVSYSEPFVADPEESSLLRRWTIDAATEENETRYDLIRLGDMARPSADETEPLAPGAYFLRASAPGQLESSREPTHYLNISTAVLTLKHTADRLTVWAVDIASGAPIVGERISVYNQLGDYQGGALTDERGIAQIHVWYTPEIWRTGLTAVLDSAGHFGIANSNWSDGYRYYPDSHSREMVIYTDRPVYRPGQPVYFRGILRSKHDVVYMPPPYETVQATLRGDRGKSLEKIVLNVSEFGSFHGEFNIPADASLGRYSISIGFPKGNGEYSRGFDKRADFLVAEYRLPQFQVNLRAQQPEILKGEAAVFELESKYFFGGPVSDAQGEYTVYATPFKFDYQGDGYYDFADRDQYRRRTDEFRSHDEVAAGTLTTDDDGRVQFEIDGAILAEPGARRLRVEAAIRDEAGHTVADIADLVVHDGLLYLGARPEKYVYRVGEDSVINIIAVDWHSQPIADQAVEAQVIERRWTRTQEQDLETGRVSSRWDFEEIPVTEGSVTTDENGKARFIYRPPKGGSFNIMVSTRDERGNRVSATTRSWVSGRSHIRWGRADDKTIELVSDRKQYRVGETAQILIASPFQGETRALISLERGDVLSTELVTLTSNSHIYEFEILPEHAPNVFVSVVLLKPADEHHPFADWRRGAVQLLVDPERYALKIDISAEPQRAEPQAEVAFRLKVTDWKGDPVAAEVGVALTDLAALSLGERKDETLLETFFSPQSLAVHTASALVHNADEVTAELVKAMGTLPPMEAMFDCCFGGGGYRAIAPPVSLEPRSEFVDTPYWNPSLVTDERGEAAFTLRLPDNLTTWRLDARALTEGRAGRLLVGENTFDLVSTRPLLIRPVTPRFFTVGDKPWLAAVVNNNTGADVTADVSILNAAGLEFADPSGAVQRVTIPADGRARVAWPVAVLDVASVAPSFAVQSVDRMQGDASISPVSADADGTLPVYRYEAPETVGTAGALMEGGGRVEAVLLPRDQDVRSGSLDIRIDKSLAAVTNESLTWLEASSRRYRPCATAIVSRFLPNIATSRALNELGLAKPELKARLDEQASRGLRQLYARQQVDGGWSWCSYPKSHSLTTAFALIGLAEAKRLGYPVNDMVIWRAQRFLERRLISPSLTASIWQLNRQAFLLYALAYSGEGHIVQTAALFEQRARLNLDAIAFLAKALHLTNPADTGRLDALTQMMLNRAVTRATGVFFEERYQDRWNWSSNTRTTALVLDALLKLQPDSPLLPNIARHLVSVREGRGHWASRQETAWAISALTNWMLASGELAPDYAWSLSLNDRPLYAGSASARNVLDPVDVKIDVADMIQRETNLVDIARGAGAGALYYTAHLNLDLPVAEIQPISRGIEISRSYTLLGDDSGAAISAAAIGDIVQVRLRIAAQSTLRYVAIEDFFPAGAEAINPQLATSAQLGTIPSGERIDARRRGWGWWYFDHIEFRDEKAVIYASYLPRGIYEFVYTIQPTVAGEYNVMPPVAQEMYFPEVYGRGAGGRFTITE